MGDQQPSGVVGMTFMTAAVALLLIAFAKGLPQNPDAVVPEVTQLWDHAGACNAQAIQTALSKEEPSTQKACGMLMKTAGTDESKKYKCPCFNGVHKDVADAVFHCKFLAKDDETVYEQWEACKHSHKTLSESAQLK